MLTLEGCCDCDDSGAVLWPGPAKRDLEGGRASSSAKSPPGRPVDLEDCEAAVEGLGLLGFGCSF